MHFQKISRKDPRVGTMIPRVRYSDSFVQNVNATCLSEQEEKKRERNSLFRTISWEGSQIQLPSAALEGGTPITRQTVSHINFLNCLSVTFSEGTGDRCHSSSVIQFQYHR
jgi:hypothetical protein